jgi:hypothetical protein
VSCACERVDRGGYFLRVHVPGCLTGAGLVGGEWENAEGKADARAATEECQANDYAQMHERGDT